MSEANDYYKSKKSELFEEFNNFNERSRDMNIYNTKHD